MSQSSPTFVALQTRVREIESLACDTYDDARRIQLNRDGPVTAAEARAVRNAEMRLARCLDAAAGAREILAAAQHETIAALGSGENHGADAFTTKQGES